MYNADLLDGLVASFWIQGVLYCISGLDKIVNVDSRSFAEDAPNKARQVEQKRLNEQYYWYPLVVPDMVLDCGRLHWNSRRNVISVRHPADLDSVQ